MLDRAGQIRLPPVSYVRHNPLAKRARPAPVLIDTTSIEGKLQEIQPLEFEQVRRTGHALIPTANKELEKLEKLRQQELQNK